jgi:hypothetical protein
VAEEMRNETLSGGIYTLSMLLGRDGLFRLWMGQYYPR